MLRLAFFALPRWCFGLVWFDYCSSAFGRWEGVSQGRAFSAVIYVYTYLSSHHEERARTAPARLAHDNAITWFDFLPLLLSSATGWRVARDFQFSSPSAQPKKRGRENGARLSINGCVSFPRGEMQLMMRIYVCVCCGFSRCRCNSRLLLRDSVGGVVICIECLHVLPIAFYPGLLKTI